MTGLAILLSIGLALFWAASVIATAWMLAHPPRRTYAAAVARGRPGDPSELDPPRSFDSWTLRTRGLDLPVWEIAGDDPHGHLVILTHGWADSRIGGLLRVPAIAPFASHVILWDLPGHGDAPGVCRLGTAEAEDLRALLDATAAESSHRTAAAREGVPACRAGTPGRVVLYGWSLGAGLSIVVARDDPRVAGVIAESPYRLPATPARNVLEARALPYRLSLLPALWLLGLLTGAGPRFPRSARVDRSSGRRSAFDRAVHSAALRCPLLVIHGTDDEVCPVAEGRAIAAAAPSGRIVEIAGAGHNNLWTDQGHAARCGEEVARFLESIRAGPFAGDTLAM